MTRRDWKLFSYGLANFFFGNHLDEAYEEGLREGATYAARELSFSIRNLDTSKMTKTQRIGHEASLAAVIEAKKDVMRKTGANL